MKLTYLWQKRNYKPEYEPDDFARVNGMEDYNPVTVLKLMVKLYSLWCQENWPDYYSD